MVNMRAQQLNLGRGKEDIRVLFNSARALEHIRQLSQEIGPRLDDIAQSGRLVGAFLEGLDAGMCKKLEWAAN